MKRIGLLGGVSWESSLVYYRLITIRDELGGMHRAIAAHSVPLNARPRCR